MSLRDFAGRLEALDERLKQRFDSVSYPDWFLMPTNEGIRLLLATGLLGLASLNTGNNLIYLVFGLMLSIVVLAYVVSSINLHGISILVRSSGSVYAGEGSVILLKVFNSKRIGSYSLNIRLPGVFGAEGRAPYIAGRSSFSLRAQITPSGRGVFEYGDFVVESGFPFIFFRRRRKVRVEGALIVYPRLMEIELNEFSAYSGAGVQMLRPGEGDDLFSLRKFREGDDRKAIHWKASARAGGLMVREYSANRPRTATIMLDSSGGDAPEAFEKALSYAASTALWLIDRGYYVGLFACGFEVHFGTGRMHLLRIMDALTLSKEETSNECSHGADNQGAIVLIRKSASSRGMHMAEEPSVVVFADTL